MSLEQAIKERFEKNEPKIPRVTRSTLTVKEVADYIGLSVDLVYKLVRQKKIPFIKVGSRILFKMVSIERWLNELEHTPK